MDPKDFSEKCLQELFLEQCVKTPNAIAVVDGSIELTYQELNDLSDQLAIQLIEEYDVKPDAVVGILLPRSVQYVIAYCAILKAGGAYMPLELVYPKPLLERAVTETHTKVVFTNAQYVNRVQEQPHLILNDVAPFFTPAPCTETLSYPPPSYVAPKPDDLAFCVMSSGTTGVPKGICQTHRAAVHSYVDRFVRYPYHKDDDGAVQDRIGAGVFFVWECYRPLCQGATCVVIPDHVLFDPIAVTKFVETNQITRWLVTPSLLQLIMDTLEPDVLKERLHLLRYLWLCGEVVSKDLAVGFTTLLPKVELMNLYSISECHDVSIGDLKRDLDPSRKYATCGIRIPGVEFFIVDLEQSTPDQLKLVSGGETGEVYVGGPVIGRGYLNMPEKTAERFVTNPFDHQETCPRLYRTGDLGRVLPDGQLEILGRCDFMVKIRGYSVVLGAIETALAKHPKLSSCVVLAVGQEGSKDGKKLVAYVVPTNWHDAPSASSVRHFLKEHVPPYAIPSTFCVIDALPVAAAAAGKLDRKALPNPETAPRLRAFSEDLGDDPTASVTAPKRMAPTNDFEEGIMEIWSQLLGVASEELSIVDDFYEVGGHSLLATKLVALVNKKFDRTAETGGLNILQVVEKPTIRAMAEKLEKGASFDDEETKIDLQAEAETLDPSIYPFATRKANAMSRVRVERSLMRPRVVFLTGATGYLGSHILAELLLNNNDVTVIALARAKTDESAKERLLKTLNKYSLLSALENLDQENAGPEQDESHQSALEERLIGVAGDLSKPLLGMDLNQFKALALEIDSIIHCGAEVNLVKPYSSLKESNVLGTQEVLRLATTNGFIKTKVKPIHYISTNGIFPVDTQAYNQTEPVEGASPAPVCVKEDVNLDELAPFLREGYSMTKWVAERMCNVAESRGLPVSVLRPGNMAGNSTTGVQNPDDLNKLLIEGMIQANCAPIVDTNYALDLTPVDFAARAVVHVTVKAPHCSVGQRMHLQTPQKPVPLQDIVGMLREKGHALESVTRDEWMKRIEVSNEKLASGWLSFEKYFEASTWMEFSSTNLQAALKEASIVTDPIIPCPAVDASLLERWFPKAQSI